MSDTVKCLSLFAGIGGFEVGMSPCGFRFTNTLEWDENCCITLNANKAATGALEDDIRPIDIMKMNPKDFSQKKLTILLEGLRAKVFLQQEGERAVLREQVIQEGLCSGTTASMLNIFSQKHLCLRMCAGFYRLKKVRISRLSVALSKKLDINYFGEF